MWWGWAQAVCDAARENIGSCWAMLPTLISDLTLDLKCVLGFPTGPYFAIEMISGSCVTSCDDCEVLLVVGLPSSGGCGLASISESVISATRLMAHVQSIHKFIFQLHTTKDVCA